MSDESSAYIREELEAIRAGESRRWWQIGCLLDQVEDTRYWMEDGRSFTHWMHKHAAEFPVKWTSLWRYMSSARYYKAISREIQEKGIKGINCPKFEVLPKNVGPEALEYLSKISRVAPDDIFYPLANNFLSGKVTREELREVWETFRPALAGRTARGRGGAPKIDAKNSDQSRMVMEAWVATILKNDTQWLRFPEQPNPPFMKEVFPRVCVRDSTRLILRQDIEIDVVIVAREKRNSPIEYHGVVVTDSFGSDVINRLRVYSVLCDCTWVVVSDGSGVFKHFTKDQLGRAGIMVTDGECIMVEKPAVYSTAWFRELLAMNLFEQSLPK